MLQLLNYTRKLNIYLIIILIYLNSCSGKTSEENKVAQGSASGVTQTIDLSNDDNTDVKDNKKKKKSKTEADLKNKKQKNKITQSTTQVDIKEESLSTKTVISTDLDNKKSTKNNTSDQDGKSNKTVNKAIKSPLVINIKEKCNPVEELKKLKLGNLKIIHGNKHNIVVNDINQLIKTQDNIISTAISSKGTILNDLEKEGSEMPSINTTHKNLVIEKDSGIAIAVLATVIGTVALYKIVKWGVKRNKKKETREFELAKMEIESKQQITTVPGVVETQQTIAQPVSSNVSTTTVNSTYQPGAMHSRHLNQNYTSPTYRHITVQGNENYISNNTFENLVRQDVKNYKNTFIELNQESKELIRIISSLDDSENNNIFIYDEDNITTIEGTKFLNISNFPSIAVYQLEDIKCLDLLYLALTAKYGNLDLQKLKAPENLDNIVNEKKTRVSEEQKVKNIFSSIADQVQEMSERIQENTQQTDDLDDTSLEVMHHLSKYQQLNKITSDSLIKYGLWLAELKCKKDKILKLSMNVIGEFLSTFCLERFKFEVEKILEAFQKRDNEIEAIVGLKNEPVNTTNNNQINSLTESIKEIDKEITNLLNNYTESSKFLENYGIIQIYNNRKNMVLNSLKNNTIDNIGSFPEYNSDLIFQTDQLEFLEFNNDMKRIDEIQKKVKIATAQKKQVGEVINSGDIRLILKTMNNVDLSELEQI